MADSNNVYKRITNWNEEIIQPINELATNPPDGCDPVDELPEAEKDHLWKKQDIVDVHDKLKEICPDSELTDPDTPQLVTVTLIQEIEDAIANGWCKECEDTTRTWYLDTINVEKRCCSFDNYADTPVDERAWQIPFLNARTALGQISTTYTNAQQQRCYWHHKALDLKDELTQLENELLQLEAAVPPNPAAIAAKQAEINSKQAELDDAEAQRDDYKNQAETAMTQYETDATSLISALALSDQFCPHVNLMDYMSSIPNTPWTRTECENEANPQPKRGFWYILAKREGGITVSIGGNFTPSGVPYPSRVNPWMSGGLVGTKMALVGFDSRYTSRSDAEAWCESLLTEDPYTYEVTALLGFS